MRGPTIERFMTAGVRTIGVDAPLERAHQQMNEHRIRHLLVLDGGRVVGLVSQRDLHLIETLHDVDPKSVQVEEAMTQDVLAVETGTPLREVVREMRERRAGSAVITRRGRPEGIFTTTDALRAIEELAGGSRARAGRPARAGTGRAATRRTGPRAAGSKRAASRRKP